MLLLKPASSFSKELNYDVSKMTKVRRVSVARNRYKHMLLDTVNVSGLSIFNYYSVAYRMYPYGVWSTEYIHTCKF